MYVFIDIRSKLNYFYINVCFALTKRPTCISKDLHFAVSLFSNSYKYLDYLLVQPVLISLTQFILIEILHFTLFDLIIKHQVLFCNIH